MMNDDKWIKYGWGTTWKSRDKKTTRLCDIDTIWLSNIARHLRRQAQSAREESCAAAGYSGQGDMACMEADHSSIHYANIADRLERKAEVFEKYLRWREEKCYILHAPRPQKKKRAAA